MPFKLKYKNTPFAFKQTVDGGGEWNYEGGDEETANVRTRKIDVSGTGTTDREIWELNKDGVQDNYSDFETFANEAQNWRDSQVETQTRDDWENTEHWSKGQDHIYKDHGGSMLEFLKRKVRGNFGDSFRAGTWKEDFEGRNNPEQVQWFTDAFNNSKSYDEFVDWSKVNAPYVLERGTRSRNTGSRTTRGKTNWKS